MRRCLLLILFCLASTLTRAEGPAFDLSGPKVDVHVKRGSVTLPISEAPNLLPGDRLWIHADMPDSQSARFVLVVAFLRGSTNPPPPEWFTRVETWNPTARSEGVFVTVPAEAQQALIFLAPETGGDFNTLRKAVHDRPGAFVRATQDLQAASWDRMRLESYLANVRITSQTDPKSLKTHAEMAARSLGIKLNQDCFDRPTDQQVSCLSQNSAGLVLDDANAQSLVDQLTSGSTADLMNQLSYSSMAGGGLYSPYIGAVVDTARILSSLHTAHFQYIPALALPTADTLNLRLNVPPSFRNPKSVVVVALPPLGPARPQPLRPVNPADSFCVQKPNLVLPSEGAPLLFATHLAHDLVLHVEARGDSKTAAVDVPLNVDPSQGGLVPAQALPTLPGGELTGEVRGKWGFDDWVGPQFQLVSSQPGKWALASGDHSALVVGREDTLHLEGENPLCVQKVMGQTSGGSLHTLSWKAPKPNSLEVAMPLREAAPGTVNVSVYQYGLQKPDQVALQAYAEAASLQGMTLSAGDPQALLKGTRLDEVASADLDGIALAPAALDRVEDRDQLIMRAAASTASLQPGKEYMAHVKLRDGRQLQAPVTIQPPRPQVTLLSKGIQNDPSAASSPVQLGSPDDLPVEGRLVFFLKSSMPANFSRREKVEVAAADSSFDTTLTLSDGSLMLEDSKTAVGSVEPLARFGSSAFGPVRVRVVAADGATGDWLPLGTLVRLPGFKELHCPRAVAKPCVLTGSNLFLASSIAASPTFDNAMDVSPEFTGTQLIVPHAANGVLYLKLRDDPATVQTLTLPVMPVAPGTQQAVGVFPPAAAAAEPAASVSSDAASSASADSEPVPSKAASSPAAAVPSTSAKAESKSQPKASPKSDSKPEF